MAFAATMEPLAANEATEVFDLLMGDLLRTSNNQASKDRLRSIKELDGAAITLRRAWLDIRENLAADDAALRAVLDTLDVPALDTAADVVGEIAREPDEDFRQNSLSATPPCDGSCPGC